MSVFDNLKENAPPEPDILDKSLQLFQQTDEQKSKLSVTSIADEAIHFGKLPDGTEFMTAICKGAMRGPNQDTNYYRINFLTAENEAFMLKSFGSPNLPVRESQLTLRNSNFEAEVTENGLRNIEYINPNNPHNISTSESLTFQKSGIEELTILLNKIWSAGAKTHNRGTHNQGEWGSPT